MFEGVASLGGSSLGGVGRYLYQRWLALRSLLIGLRIAWVSTASAAIGLLLFLGAAPAQDILLEVNHDDGLWFNLFAWVPFYAAVILFWALPIVVSARWILTRFEQRSDRHPHMEPVPARIRTFVPAVLATLCFVAVLTGQLTALRVAPPLGDNARAFIAEAESAIREGKELASNAATVVGAKMVRRDNVPVLALAVAALLALWLFLARPSALARLFAAQPVRRAATAVAACLAVATGYTLAVLAFGVLAGSLPWRPIWMIWMPLALTIAAVIWLAWLGRERLLWWLGAAFAIVGAAVVAFTVNGALEVEQSDTFGLAHLHLLPLVSAAAAAIALWGLSPRSSGEATRIGRLLLRLIGAREAHSDRVATARLVNPIFYGLVFVTVALNVLFIVVPPSDLTGPWGVNRSSLLPIVLGLPIAAFTWLSYGAARSRVPLVLAVLALLVVWNVRGKGHYQVRTVELSTPRPILNEAVEQWADANGCRLPPRPSEAPKEEPLKELCPSPIIVAAAGGASRAAFHLAGVLGKLLDDEKFAPLEGHRGIVYSAAFNHDGSLIATGSLDRSVRIWNGRTGGLTGTPNVADTHKARVQSVAFSRKGQRLVTASRDRTAKVWDVSKRGVVTLLATLRVGSNVNSAAFSPDGKLVVTGSDDGSGRIWEWEKEKEQATPRATFGERHGNYVYAVAFSPDPDGRHVLTASWDGTVKIWDVSNLDDVKKPVQTLQRTSAVYSAAFSPNGKLIATGALDGKTRIWEWESNPTQPRRELPAHKKLVFGVAFSKDPDGRLLLATASWDRTAKIWDVSNLDAVRPHVPDLRHDKDVNSAAFNHDGTLIVTASDDKTARIWKTATGERAQWEESTDKFRPFSKQLFAISAVSGGALGATVTYAALADSQRGGGDAKSPPCNERGLRDRDWFAAAGGRLDPTKNPTMSWRACLQLLVAGDFLSPAVVGLTRDLLPIRSENRGDLLEKSWEKRYRWYTQQAEPKDAPERAMLAEGTLAIGLTEVRRGAAKGWLPILLLNGTSVEDGKRIVTSDVDLSIQLDGTGAMERLLYDAYDFHRLLTGLGHDEAVYAVAAAADGSRIATASKDKTARIWDLKTSTLFAEAVGHGAEVRGVAFSPNGTRLITASWDRTARIWDLSGGGKIEALTVLAHAAAVNSAAFSPDGRLVVTGANDGKVRIWDAQTGAPKTELEPAHRSYVYAVAFSPNGKRLISASWDRTAKLWDVSNLGEIKEIRTLAHRSDVNSAAFSPDGRLIVTGADDGQARIWDGETGDLRAELPPHTHFVYGAAFSPDARRLVTASLDGTAKVWDVSDLGQVKELRTLRHGPDVNSVVFTPDGKLIVAAAEDGRVRIWSAETGKPGRLPCPRCDVRLSTAVTMSARFPLVSPTGRFVDRNRKPRGVVDGGYYENFGATTAMDLARALKQHWGLEPMVVLVNNDHEVTGLECVTGDRPTNVPASWLWSPLSALIGTTTARGSHAAVSLCEELRKKEVETSKKELRKEQDRFAFITVSDSKANEHMTLSVSWWMSKNVQSYLDQQLGGDKNRSAFSAIDRLRVKTQRAVSSLPKRLADR